MALWGSITFFQKRYSVIGLYNVFFKALLNCKKCRRYGVMEVDNAFFKNITHYRYLLKGPIDVMGYWLFFVQRYVCMALWCTFLTKTL